MTLWQDQTSRRNRADAGGHPHQGNDEGQDPPLSRREAREQERRAADAVAEGRAHPSGVVDFSAPDIRELADGGAFADPNSSDIWEALSRRPGAAAADGDAGPGRSGRRASAPAPAVAPPAVAPQAPVPAAGLPPVSDDLMQRVRAAMLRRQAEPTEATAVVPVVPVPQPSRRELRDQVAPQTTDDGLPASWFAGTGAVDTVAVPAQEIPPAFSGLPEPDELPDTRAMPALDRASLEAQSPMTAPVNLPQFLSAPVEDALTFSDPVQFARPEPHGAHPAVAPSAAALPEPGTETTETDLAGFEALIRRARTAQPEASAAQRQAPHAPPEALQPNRIQAAPMPQQPMPAQNLQPQRAQQRTTPQEAAPKPFAPWYDEADDDAAGFSGSVAREVTSGHGSPNALIMPTDPQSVDVTQAVSGTGDIFITGSHHLPRSLGRTGAAGGRWDSADVDRLFDASQEEPAAGVAPVRAARAVSGGPAARAVVTPRRVGSGAMPTVLAVIAGVMALGVMTLLVGSWVLRLF